VKFTYFGISYNNPCSPLSLSLLPAPRSSLQAHVLATSMVEDAFRQADKAPGFQERVQDMVLDAFTVVDEVHAHCVENDNASQSMDNMEV
jgi:hypothetical protein